MESFSCTALHFITSVCQLYLIYKVSKGHTECEASICEWVIALEREIERGDGRVYHSLTWHVVLQLSLVKLEVSHFCHYSYKE